MRYGIAALIVPLLLLVRAASAAVYEAIPGESSLSYTIYHPLHKARGVSKDFLCRVDLAPDTLASSVTVSADVRSFKSGHPTRDQHAYDAVLARHHPLVEFASDSVSKDPGGGRSSGFRIHGKVHFAGKSQSIDFPVISRQEGDKVRITGSFRLKFSDFDIKRPTVVLIPIEDRLDISFDLVAKDPYFWLQTPGALNRPEFPN